MHHKLSAWYHYKLRGLNYASDTDAALTLPDNSKAISIGALKMAYLISPMKIHI